MEKNIVAGLGETGGPILKLISKYHTATGYDIKQTNKKLKAEILHICIPSLKFETNVMKLFKKFEPKLIVIHSTIPPNMTAKLQKKLPIPVLYSPIRGVHGRMLEDLKRYTKYFAIEKNAPRSKWAISTFESLMKKCNVKTEKMSDPITLELAKIIVDTSYYGWLINYAQISKMIADKHDIDYDEMWKFSDEIHKYLGNRPKMFPGVIGGHCVIPNLKLVDEKSLYEISHINKIFEKTNQ